MPSFVVHGILPLLVLLSVPWLDRRKVWWLWPLTFVPDADYALPGLHRAVTGNLFLLLPFVAVLLWARRNGRRDLVEWMGIATTYLATHLVMDVFTGGSVLFYPITDYNVCYLAAIDVVTATNTPVFYFEACSEPGIPTVSPVYPWLSVSEGAMLAFLLPAWAILGALTLWRRRRDRDDAA